MSEGTLSDNVPGVTATGLPESGTNAEGSGACTLRVQASWMAVGMLVFLLLGSFVQIMYKVILSSSSLIWLSNGGPFPFSMSVTLFAGGGLVFALAKGRLTGLVDTLSRRYVRSGLLARDLGIAIALMLLIRELFVNSQMWARDLFANKPFYVFDQALRICATSLPTLLAAMALVRLSRTSGKATTQKTSDTFDTEGEIRRWRTRLSESESFSKDDAIELEEHLREEMAVLVGKGSCEREAFAAAYRRIGPPDTVEREYDKVNAGLIWRMRAYWVVTGALLMFSATLLYGTLLHATLFVLPELLPGWIPALSSSLFLSIRIAFWFFGYVLFMHIATKPQGGIVRWLQRRHERPSALLLDLTVLAIALAVITVAVSSRGYSTGLLNILWILMLANVPMLFLFYVGILCLHPSMHRRDQA